jgi:uncharacterized protein with HEPN domain
MRDDRERLQDILKAIDQIEIKTHGGREAFGSDEMLQVWVLHHLQIIGEAARCLSPDFRERHPDKVWSMAAGMRNILVHHYFEIDAEQVWKVVEHDLAPLQKRILEILQGKG